MNDPYTVIGGQMRFSGNCEECRPFCGAICCKNTFILLSEEEKNSGKYDYIEPTEGCNCAGCQLMRQRKAVALRRNSNGCIYLNGENKCNIYKDERPTMCKSFDCRSTWWKLVLSSVKAASSSAVTLLGEEDGLVETGK